MFNAEQRSHAMQQRKPRRSLVFIIDRLDRFQSTVRSSAAGFDMAAPAGIAPVVDKSPAEAVVDTEEESERSSNKLALPAKPAAAAEKRIVADHTSAHTVPAFVGIAQALEDIDPGSAGIALALTAGDLAQGRIAVLFGVLGCAAGVEQ